MTALWRILTACLLTALLGEFAPPALADTSAPAAPTGPTPSAKHKAFLDDAALLLSDAERVAFLALPRDYQRDAFIERFWEARDPFPQTARNEFREGWEERAATARKLFPDLKEDRAKVLLLLGPPAGTEKPLCRSLLLPLEIWAYPRTAERRRGFTLVFVQPQGNARGRYRLWHPTEGLEPLFAFPGGLSAASGDLPAAAEREIEAQCSRGGEVLGGLADAAEWDLVVQAGHLQPQPNEEWLKDFEARTTDLPAQAALLPATLEVRYPGRYQSRTLVEAVLAVPSEGPTPGGAVRGLLVDGEVLREGELFDHFRYKFELPAPGPGKELPVLLQRMLRPGAYTLIVKLEDLDSHRFFRAERELAVPRIEAAGEPTAPAGAPGAPAGALAEAHAAAPGHDQTLKLLSPRGDALLTARLRVEATTTGEGIARVVFSLNGKAVLSKTKPPYSVEIDLGRAPRTHRLHAAALDGGGHELASDDLLLNGGPNQFRVRLVQPQRGQRYVQSLRAMAEVDVPYGDRLERVEFFLNEERVATLFQPPFAQPILLPPGRAITYVRAAAYLADGNSTEDLVFINAPANVEDLHVDFIELYATVSDRRGRPIDGLQEGDFRVFEDGAAQEVRRFERVKNLPVHAGVLLDVSASMTDRLAETVAAALRFFQLMITPRDRAAVFTFNERPALVVPFTHDPGVLAGGLAHLVAEGETAIWDSLVYALHYFGGVKGKRAIVLLSDGDDTRSRYSFDEALDFARHSGTAIYTVGLGLSPHDVMPRTRLRRLADETGGRAYFIERAAEMEGIYRQVQEELRSQYLIAYQSTQHGASYRAVDLKVNRPGLEARTIRGYLP